MASAVCCPRIPPAASLRTATGSFIVPEGIYHLEAWVIGGGGGGNPGYGVGGANGAGSGGGAGGTAYSVFNVFPGAVINYTIGGNAAPANPGSVTTLTFGAFTLTGNGGQQGFNNSGPTAGGTATGGQFNITGGSGGSGSGGNLGGGSGGSINGGNGSIGNGTCGGTPTQAPDFHGMRAALTLAGGITILGVATPGCFGSGQINGANSAGFGNAGSGTSAGPNSFGGSGNRGGGGGGSAANNSTGNTGGFGAAGGVLLYWY